MLDFKNYKKRKKYILYIKIIVFIILLITIICFSNQISLAKYKTSFQCFDSAQIAKCEVSLKSEQTEIDEIAPNLERMVIFKVSNFENNGSDVKLKYRIIVKSKLNNLPLSFNLSKINYENGEEILQRNE